MSGTGGQADAGYLLDASGPAAPPRDNGELTFAAPWESQAFGLAMALQEAGHIDWEDFSQRLIAEVGAWEAGQATARRWSYYECWLRALERVVGDRGLIAERDLRARGALLAARPPDHAAPETAHEHAHGGPAHEHAHGGPAHEHADSGSVPARASDAG